MTAAACPPLCRHPPKFPTPLESVPAAVWMLAAPNTVAVVPETEAITYLAPEALKFVPVATHRELPPVFRPNGCAAEEQVRPLPVDERSVNEKSGEEDCE